MISLSDALQSAGDFLRRHTKSKAVRDAERRRQERRQQLAMRQAKRGATVAGVTAIGTFGYAITVTPVAMAAVAAGGAAVAGVALLQLCLSAWPRKQTFSRDELMALPMQAEEWLLDKRSTLPLVAAGSVDAILTALGDLPRHLARVDPASTLAWEARRLIGEHLPVLVNGWTALPAATRERDGELLDRLVSGLGTISAELIRIAEEASRDERASFETRERYLGTRYGDESFTR
jgi:hypothetical protein